MTIEQSAFALLLASSLLLGACSEPQNNSSRSDDVSTDESVMEPAFETDQATLDAALLCSDFTHVDKPAVLLVHGTFTMGEEHFPWNYKPLLRERGFDVCTVTYPDRGLIDIQISAEYVVNALRQMAAASERKVAIIGHSQGATMPRWAIKWWGSARDAVSDFVLIAGPNHGTSSRDNPVFDAIGSAAGLPAAIHQMTQGSNFITRLNEDDETPGEIDYTTIYTQFDELVQPVAPVPTAALDWQQDNPNVANILVQEVCPGLLADHLTVGTTDAMAFELVLDALLHEGPANVERAGGPATLCAPLPPLPQQNIGVYTITGVIEALQAQGPQSIPEFHLSAEEPPLKPYAQRSEP